MKAKVKFKININRKQEQLKNCNSQIILILKNYQIILNSLLQCKSSSQI